MKKYSAFILYFLFMAMMVLLPAISNAQTGGGDFPCGGDDPYSDPCPLDTWVIILVVLAALFGVLYLKHKQKLPANR